MNTIDMNQVAGLQAVDAEGNVIGTLSVDDLTNLVANNLVKSTQNQIAAQSVSTLSDATTLAASDEYENTLPVDDNPKSVRTLDAAGNPKQTGINALATVVGGLLITISGKQITATNKTVGQVKEEIIQIAKYTWLNTKEPNRKLSLMNICIFGGGTLFLNDFANDDTICPSSGVSWVLINSQNMPYSTTIDFTFEITSPESNRIIRGRVNKDKIVYFKDI